MLVDRADRVANCLPREQIEIHIAATGLQSRRFEIRRQAHRHAGTRSRHWRGAGCGRNRNARQVCNHLRSHAKAGQRREGRRKREKRTGQPRTVLPHLFTLLCASRFSPLCVKHSSPAIQCGWSIAARPALMVFARISRGGIPSLKRQRFSSVYASPLASRGRTRKRTEPGASTTRGSSALRRGQSHFHRMKIGTVPGLCCRSGSGGRRAVCERLLLDENPFAFLLACPGKVPPAVGAPDARHAQGDERLLNCSCPTR